MARRKRGYRITGNEYTFGSASGAEGGNFRIMHKSATPVSAGGDGILISSGDEIKVQTEAGLAIQTDQRNFSRVYFDNAFEMLSGTASVDTSGDYDALPTGMSLTTNADGVDGDTGYFDLSGTPDAAAEGDYNIRINFGDSWTTNHIIYKLAVWPQGTTPTWSSTNIQATRIIRNLATRQNLTVVPTAPEAVAFRLENVTGFETGINLLIDTDGQVYVENVGDILNETAAAVSFDVVIDLGQYGTVTQSFTGNMTYGDPYGAIYWGPGNSKTGNWDSYDVSYTGAYLTDAQYDALWNHNVTSGALRCRTNNQYSTSPYRYNGSYGLRYTENWSTSSGNIGYLGPKCSSNLSTSSNGRVLRFKWTVPNGVNSFCVVAVGAGCMGAYQWAQDGGGGGGLAWVNDVTCTPGEEFDIAIGLPRRTEANNSSYWSGSTWMRRINDIGYGANEFIVIGYGGGYQNGHSSPLNARSNPQPSNLSHIEQYSSNQSRDSGSAAASTRYGTYGRNYGGYASGRGGGGAAGYQGAGGQSNNSNGSGGSAGAGHDYSSTWGTSAGGGVGLDGRGAGGNDNSGSGYGGTNGAWTSNYESDGTNSYYYAGGGGSGGSRGCYGENNYTGNGGIQNRYINGGMHGGGGGGSGTSWGGGSGGAGGLRIIWGSGRAFPFTKTTEDPAITDSRNPGDGR